MMPALQQQLIAAVPDGFLNFLLIGFNIGDIGIRMAGNAIEIAEFTIGNANIGGIYIPVDLPGNFSVRHLLFPQFIGHIHQFGKRGVFKQETRLLQQTRNSKSRARL